MMRDYDSHTSNVISRRRVLEGALAASALFAVMRPGHAAQARPPIIDMHLHSYAANWAGPTPLPACAEAFVGCATPIPSSPTDDELMQRTIAFMDQYNVVKAIASGQRIDVWKAKYPDRIMAGLGVGAPFDHPPTADLKALRALLTGKRYEAIAEFAPQYDGIGPDALQLESYFALAEELDIPLGIHIGIGPPGAAYIPGFTQNYRAELTNPLLLEPVLVKHPKLRLYVMHAGWPMLDQMIALLYAHPQVHVDVAVINWFIPRAEFHTYLQRLVQAGLGKRIMFGSDQMLWPEAIGWAVEGIDSAGFLTAEQKRDIFYNNAARFLRLA
jgi:uncharacterized protein